jgi:hypothetical protein
MTIRILTNAKVYTGHPGTPWAESLALVDGTVSALDADALSWSEMPSAEIEDMNQALILPGLTDAHIHMMWYAHSLRALNLRDCTRQTVLDQVADRAAELPSGQWITGRGWDQNIWEDATFPTAREIDRVAPHHPVALTAKSGHAMVVNSAALEAAGITSETPDPVHGKFARDRDGRPTGVAFEHAMNLIKNRIPPMPLRATVDLLDEAQDHLLRLGITGVHDVDGEPAFAAFQTLKAAHRLRMRVVKYVRRSVLDETLALGLRSGFGDDQLRFGGLKLFADGALGARTAAMFEPYEGEPQNKGLLTLEPEQLREIARRAVQGGVPLAIHAIGDRTNRIVLDILEDVQPLAPQLRHRIEHVQLIEAEDQRRLADAGIVASMQPIHAVHDVGMAERYWGTRSRNAYAWRSLKEAGAVLAFGSDAPIEIFDPFAGLYAAVTRRSETNGEPGPQGWYPEQRLNLAEAIDAYTWGAAYAAGMENRLGRLVPGYHADLIVLDRDIFSLPPESLLETRVERVMIEGVWQNL